MADEPSSEPDVKPSIYERLESWRPIVAYLLLLAFIVAPVVGVGMWFGVAKAFIALGVTSGIAALILGSE